MNADYLMRVQFLIAISFILIRPEIHVYPMKIDSSWQGTPINSQNMFCSGDPILLWINFVMVRTVWPWNSVPQNMVDSPLLEVFKQRLTICQGCCICELLALVEG